jgi:hypothetical protein
MSIGKMMTRSRKTVEKTKTQTGQQPTENKVEDWVKTKWRPIMAWTYMSICVFDFIIGPIITMIYSSSIGITYIPWISITLSNGGVFHMAMGAILGAAAWTRGQEKIRRVERDPFFNEDYKPPNQDPFSN